MLATVIQLPIGRQRAAGKAVLARQARRHIRIRHGLACASWCQTRHNDGSQTHQRTLALVDAGKSQMVCLQLEQEPYEKPSISLLIIGGKGPVRLGRSEVETLVRQLNVGLGYLPH
jgi:hypothetical protein